MITTCTTILVHLWLQMYLLFAKRLVISFDTTSIYSNNSLRTKAQWHSVNMPCIKQLHGETNKTGLYTDGHKYSKQWNRRCCLTIHIDWLNVRDVHLSDCYCWAELAVAVFLHWLIALVRLWQPLLPTVFISQQLGKLGHLAEKSRWSYTRSPVWVYFSRTSQTISDRPLQTSQTIMAA